MESLGKAARARRGELALCEAAQAIDRANLEFAAKDPAAKRVAIAEVHELSREAFDLAARFARGKTSDLRMRRIMQNIIRNNGTFVPTDLGA